MKTLKFALMCVAALALVACEPNKPNNPSGDNTGTEKPGENPGENPGGDVEYVSPIDVTDASLADWDNLPAEFVASAVLPENYGQYAGLKSLKVYADEMYINLAVEIDPEVITDLGWPGFHVYLDTDKSVETGGGTNQWSEIAFDVLLETAVFAEGQPNPYNPAVFNWWGEVGSDVWEGWYDPSVGTPSAENKWGGLVGEGELPIGNSQHVGNVIEIQLMWELIPVPAVSPWADEFKLAVDIQQNWTTAGIMPADYLDESGAVVLVEPLTVKFNK